MEQTATANPVTTAIVIAAVIGLVVAVGIYLRGRDRRERELGKAYNVAYLFEHIEPTLAGRFGALLLVGWNIFAAISVFYSSANIMHQVGYALIWVAGNQVFALIVMLGRRRTFLMRKPDPEGQMPQ